MAEFMTTWFPIIINVILILVLVGKKLYDKFFDRKAYIQIFFPDNQIAERKAHIINNSVTVFFKWANEDRTYTVNEKNIKYFGHKPLVQVWDNNPLTVEHKKVLEKTLDKKDIETMDKILNKLNDQIDVIPPPIHFIREMVKDEKDKLNKKDKTSILEEQQKIAVIRASELFKLAYTNLTLGLWNKPKDTQRLINYTVILIVVGVILLMILHFSGVINLPEFLGIASTTK